MAKTTTRGAFLTTLRQQSPSPADMWMRKLTGRVVMVGDCWVVDGELQRYVRIPLADGTGAMGQAHRLVFSTFNPDVDITDMHVHHVCCHAGYINPEHLVAMEPDEHRRVHAP